jgi:hypothetical protein
LKECKIEKNKVKRRRRKRREIGVPEGNVLEGYEGTTL